MVNIIVNKKDTPNLSVNIGKLLFVLSGVFLFIVGLTVLQDYLESKSGGYAFYFNESLLFKSIWFLFIPIIILLYKRLKNEKLDSFSKTVRFIVTPIVAHFFIVPFFAAVFSLLFYEGRYDLYKFLSYTFAHDLYILVIVYTGYVLGYKYFSTRSENIINTEYKPTLDAIVIHNGKYNVVVNVENIIQITSATPYIFVHLENKKHLHSETLKSICDQLDGNTFVRIHKSTVVNITKVRAFKSRLNGDYDLQLTSGDIVRLSRTYAADFKKYFNTGHRDTV